MPASRPPCLGRGTFGTARAVLPASPFSRMLARYECRITFTLVAVERGLLVAPSIRTQLPTPPRGDAVTLGLSFVFMASIVPGLPPGGVVLLEGARLLQFLFRSSRGKCHETGCSLSLRVASQDRAFRQSWE